LKGVHWTSVVGFIDMGGYGGYVWPAFGVTALVLLGLLLASLRSLRARENALAALQTKRSEDPRGE
jgi:heme exporter protein D